MRIWPSLTALLALALLSACDRPSSEDSLEGQVKAAMAGLPYEYQLQPKARNKDYVTFNVVNPRHELKVTFAYGLPGKGGGCPPLPELPPHRRGAKPDVAMGPKPLICLEDDAWRRGSDYRESIVRGRMSSDVAKALCKEVYGYWTCFI